MTAHKIAIAYHGSTPVPDGMLAHATPSCAHKLSKHPLYSTRLHLAGLSSASLSGIPPTHFGQFCLRIGPDQRAGTIENP